jgi:hypothetical protein
VLRGTGVLLPKAGALAAETPPAQTQRQTFQPLKDSSAAKTSSFLYAILAALAILAAGVLAKRTFTRKAPPGRHPVPVARHP